MNVIQNTKRHISEHLKKMIVERERRGLKNMQQWSTGLKVFKWWMEDDNMDGQLAFDMEGGDLRGIHLKNEYAEHEKKEQKERRPLQRSPV